VFGWVGSDEHFIALAIAAMIGVSIWIVRTVRRRHEHAAERRETADLDSKALALLGATRGIARTIRAAFTPSHRPGAWAWLTRRIPRPLHISQAHRREDPGPHRDDA
jgi:hypothetical protein